MSLVYKFTTHRFYSKAVVFLTVISKFAVFNVPKPLEVFPCRPERKNSSVRKTLNFILCYQKLADMANKVREAQPNELSRFQVKGWEESYK